MTNTQKPPRTHTRPNRRAASAVVSALIATALLAPQSLAETAELDEDHSVEVSADETLQLEISSNPAIDAAPNVVEGAKSVYRFWSPIYGSHFFTTDLAEVEHVMRRWPTQWLYEGVQFQAFDSSKAGTVPVYRFWSERYKSHFFTASSAEKDDVIRRWSGIWAYEGIAYHAYPMSASQGATVYRFWSQKHRSHFYTTSAQERAAVNRRWPTTWSDEGAKMKLSDFPQTTQPVDSRTVIILCDSQCDGDSWGEQGARANGFTRIIEHSVGGIGYARPGTQVPLSMTNAISTARIQLPAGKPGLVMLTLGGGDATGNRSEADIVLNMHRLVAQIQRLYPDTPIVINGVMSRNDDAHTQRRNVDRIVTREAARLGIATISVAGWGSIYKANYLDQVHLSQQGHNTIAPHYAAALSRALGLSGKSGAQLSTMAETVELPATEPFEVSALSTGVWLDENRDGWRDDTERGIAELTISVLDNDDNILGQFLSDTDGHLPVEDILALGGTRISVVGADSALYGLEHVAGLGFAPTDWALFEAQ